MIRPRHSRKIVIAVARLAPLCAYSIFITIINGCDFQFARCMSTIINV
jgi:hypothetical protein